MRRFDYDDNDEFREDVDKFFDENSGNYDDFLAEEFALQEAKIGIQHREMDLRLMRTAIKICENTFMWSFYSLPTRLKMISDTYKKLRKLEE
jgi:hypothetical protein